ncbi:MAG: hypothetical protein ACRC0A_06520, partial [Chitinophagaceae bacterium]
MKNNIVIKKQISWKFLIGVCLFVALFTSLLAQESQVTITNVNESAKSSPEIQVNNISDTMEEKEASDKKVQTLGEVVVNTALGFKKSAKSLSY